MNYQKDGTMIGALRDGLSLLFMEGWKGLNQDFSQIPYLHPFARIASQQVESYDNIRNIFHVFTDGSCKRHNAAWAFVVLCECQTQANKHFVRIGYSGYAAGMLDESIGKTRHTAADAEATAIIAGAEFLLAKQCTSNMKIFFHYDARAVGHGACGTQKVVSHTDDYSDRQQAARILLSILQQRAEVVKGLHVKAHDGHPWNECADSIAGLVCSGWQPPIQAELRSGKLLSNALREWAWVEAAPSDGMPSLEIILHNERATDPTLNLQNGKGDQAKSRPFLDETQDDLCQVHHVLQLLTWARWSTRVDLNVAVSKRMSF